MRTHASVGHSIVSATELDEEAGWVLHHHERFDGAGYPLGSTGDDIPLESRIIFVADAFEAMTADRPYRPGRSPEAALDELAAHAGTQFDPLCVGALCSIFEHLPEGADEVELEDRDEDAWPYAATPAPGGRRSSGAGGTKTPSSHPTPLPIGDRDECGPPLDRRAPRQDGRARRVRPPSDRRLAPGRCACAGRLERLDGARRRCSPTTDPRCSSTGSSRPSSRSSSRRSASSTSPTRSRASPASASTPTSSARAVGAAFRLIPTRIKTLEELGLPQHLYELGEQAARPRARHRPDRLGQVDDARGADRPDQPHALGAHPHDRGSDRVPALAPAAASSTSARSAPTRRRSPRRCAPRSARTRT